MKRDLFKEVLKQGVLNRDFIVILTRANVLGVFSRKAKRWFGFIDLEDRHAETLSLSMNRSYLCVETSSSFLLHQLSVLFENGLVFIEEFERPQEALCAIDPCGNKIAFGLRNGAVVIRSLEDSNKKSKLFSDFFGQTILGMKFNEQGSKLVAFSQDRFAVWDIEQGSFVVKGDIPYAICDALFESESLHILFFDGSSVWRRSYSCLDHYSTFGEIYVDALYHEVSLDEERVSKIVYPYEDYTIRYLRFVTPLYFTLHSTWTDCLGAGWQDERDRTRKFLSNFEGKVMWEVFWHDEEHRVHDALPNEFLFLHDNSLITTDLKKRGDNALLMVKKTDRCGLLHEDHKEILRRLEAKIQTNFSDRFQFGNEKPHINKPYELSVSSLGKVSAKLRHIKDKVVWVEYEIIPEEDDSPLPVVNPEIDFQNDDPIF